MARSLTTASATDSVQRMGGALGGSRLDHGEALPIDGHHQNGCGLLPRRGEALGVEGLEVLQPMESRHFAEQIAADEFSIDGIEWQPIAKLVRSMTGIGTIAAATVGVHSGLGVSDTISNNVLLRERVANNIAVAGELRELMELKRELTQMYQQQQQRVVVQTASPAQP